MKEAVIPLRNTQNRDKAFTTLFSESKTYHGSLQNRIKSIVKDEAVAEEIMQDVWIAALINSETLFTDTFSEKGRKAWLFKTAYYRGINYLREHAKKSGREVSGSATFIENIEDKRPSVSPEAILSNREEFNKKLEPLTTHSKDSQKTVFLYVQGYSYKEIGGALGISKQNVAGKLSRVRKKLVA